MMTVMVDDGRRGWCWTSDFNERAVVARPPHVLARRAHKTEGPVGQAPSCARASLTQDSLVPGLGGWSDRRTRAVGGSLAATPSNQTRGEVCRVPVAVQIATGDNARDRGSAKPPR